jgi:hypothetical protein
VIPATSDDELRDARRRWERAVRLSVHTYPPRGRRRRWPWLVVIALVLGLLLWIATLEAADCVRLQVRPQLLLRSGHVDVEAHVARHADHRALVIVWNSDVGAAGSRSFELEGSDRDAALVWWQNRDQPAGHYVFDARVTDAGGRTLGSSRAEIRSAEVAP